MGFTQEPEAGCRLYLKVTPKSSRNAIKGSEIDSGGKERLKITVTAPPEDGKANKAVIKLLAKTLKVPPSSITLISGETSRLKCVEVADIPSDSARKIKY